MQDNFGKKLETARINRGISLKQASEDLKIRSDFLEAFEINHGNFDMPDVYRLGFLKNYARYLKLNVDEIVREFKTYNNPKTKPSREAIRQAITSFDIENSEDAVEGTSTPISSSQSSLPFSESTPKGPLLQPVSHNDIPQTQIPRQPQRAFSANTTNTQSLYLKIGLIFGGTLAVLTLGAILIHKTLSGDTPTTQPIVASSQSDLSSPESITLQGAEKIHVVVKRFEDDHQLFSGNLDPDHPLTINRKGPVKIHYSNGSKLTVTKSDGASFKPSREGAGWIKV